MKYSILFVDDDKSILKSIKREFSFADYEIFLVESGREALKILYEEKIDIIVSDIMMPEMDGYELLKKVKYLYPNIIRVVLSGFADQKLIFKIINTNLAKTFMTKPWKENEIITTIQDILSVNEKVNNEYIKKIINSSNKLPTLPAIFNEINELIEDDRSDIDDFITLINRDQVITSKILKVINSAYYGIKTGSLKTAILNLGLVNLKSVIATSEVFGLGQNYYIDLLWKHSSVTNNMTIYLYEFIYKKRIPDTYSSAGLLHDIGKVAFFKLFEEKYANIFKMKGTASEINLSEAERNMFNFTHEELGSTIMNYWEFPAALIEVALSHHNPEESSSSYKDIVAIVHLADYYSWNKVNKNFQPVLKDSVFKFLGTTKYQIEEALKRKEFEV